MLVRVRVSYCSRLSFLQYRYEYSICEIQTALVLWASYRRRLARRMNERVSQFTRKG
jgi:hypothetical protein